MNSVAVLFFAAILAGYALINLPAISFLADLHAFFFIVGGLVIIVFSFVIIYMALKALFHKSWH